MNAPLPTDETERLAALYDHSILETEPSQEFNDIVRLAASICGTPIAAISLVAEHRQWFKAITGLVVTETPWDIAFCAHTILQPDMLIVEDARADPRFTDNPLVTNDPSIRFYAGVPLLTEEGYALGSLCVIDRTPRTLTADQEETLRLLARQVTSLLIAARRIAEMEHLVSEREHLITQREQAEATLAQTHAALETSNAALAQSLSTLQESNARLQESEARLRRLVDAAFEGIAVSQGGALVDVSSAFAALFGYDAPAQMVGLEAAGLAAPESRALAARMIAQCDEEPYEATLLRRDGTPFQAELRGRLTQLGGRPARVTAVRDITERKEMERALRESQAFTQALADDSASLIYVFDLDTGGNLYVNRGLAKFWGYSPDEIRAMGGGLVERIIHPDTAPFLLAHGGDFADLPDGQVMEFETRCRHADGGWRWVWNREVVFKRHSDGSPWQVLGTAQDITERRQAAEVLRHSQARLAKAQRIARVGSWEYDPAGRKVTWSDEMFRLLGRDIEAGVPDFGTAMSLYHPEDAPVLKSLVARAAQEGVGYELDLRGNPDTFGDGEVRWYHTTGETTGDANGEGFLLTGTLAEITDRKQMEEALHHSAELLREREANLKAVLEAAPVILYAANADGVVTLSEGTGLVALGLSAGEAVGRSLFEFNGGDAEVEESTRRALAGEAVSYDARVYGLCLHTELRPVQDADGTPAGIIGVCFDVTERKQAEALLTESQQRLDLATESAQIGIWDWDVTANKMLWDERMYALYGMREQDFSGAYDAWQNGLHWEDRERAEAEIAQVLDGNAEFHTQFRVVWPNGEVRHIEAHAIVQRAGDGSVLRMTGANWDITERWQTEQQAKDYAVVLEFQKKELEKVNAELEALATTDGLTGLKNHRAFHESLSEEVGRAARYGTPLSLILLDVDHFKQLNDTHGHPAGDTVLRAVARELQDNVRENDLVARYGGEEFGLILPQTDLAGATVFADRLREAVQYCPWPVQAVTVSVGVTALRPGDMNAADLIARADAAMYQSKKEGRNRVTIDGPDKRWP